MSYKDFTIVNSTASFPEDDAVYTKLIKGTANLINELGIFRVIGSVINEEKVVQVPACFIVPSGIDNTERLIAGNLFTNDYYCSIAVALKGANDNVIAQQLLRYEELLRRLMSKSSTTLAPRIFSDVTGHVDTRVERGFPGPVDELKGGALLFNTGVNIVYTVHETY